MIYEIAHVGMTVSDLDRSIAFYRDVLGLKFQGEVVMEGEETDRLFGRKNSRARVAYLNGSEEVMAPPVELIQFTQQKVEKQETDLFRTSVSEICFRVRDIDAVYRHLLDQGVPCLSAPQAFDFRDAGFSRSRAIYFRDPDGMILELMEYAD